MITLDGLGEEEFRRSIEMRLRRGLSGPAIERLRALIAPYAGPGGLLPERFLTVSADDFYFYGWESLADAVGRHDLPGRPVTALSIAFGWPGEEAPVPDADGRLPPCIEVGYYTDESFPFSQSARDDLLEGYSYHGCTWSGDVVAADNALSLGGIDDLNGALACLEADLLASEDPDEEGIRAGSLGACLLSALLFRAVELRIERDGLPRPLCVMAGSSGVYPYFDAPVVGMAEDERKAAEAAEALAANQGLPGPRYSSLLLTSIPRARKRAVLVLEDGAADEARRIASLRGMAHGEAESPAAPAEEPVAEAGDQAIVPIPGGPLLAKKAPKADWDFRDMLSPAEPFRSGDESAHDEYPDEEGEPEPDHQPAWHVPQHLPVEAEPVAQPGFALLEPSPQERLDSLLSRHLAPPEPVSMPQPEPQPAPTLPEPEPVPAAQAEPVDVAEAEPGRAWTRWLARLAAWTFRRRRG